MNMKKKKKGLKTTLNEPSSFPINVVLKAALIHATPINAIIVAMIKLIGPAAAENIEINVVHILEK